MSDLQQEVAPSPAERAIELLGGPSAVVKLLALKGIEITPWAVNKWRRRVPPERVLLLEELTGGQVTRHDLRPDLYPATEAA